MVINHREEEIEFRNYTIMLHVVIDGISHFVGIKYVKYK